MVDISDKPETQRMAHARAFVRLGEDARKVAEADGGHKGELWATARLAGIMAAKKTAELIPLCHPLPISHAEVDFEIPSSRDRIVITASARISAKTGVEMEALTAVSTAALTIYDMCKAIDKQMVISEIRVTSKTKR